MKPGTHTEGNVRKNARQGLRIPFVDIILQLKICSHDLAALQLGSNGPQRQFSREEMPAVLTGQTAEGQPHC